jgi:hypothetical protein
MTELLQQVITKIEQLSPDQQQLIVSRWLEELNNELLWQEKFTKTTDQQWDILADQVRNEIRQGDVIPLKD